MADAKGVLISEQTSASQESNEVKDKPVGDKDTCEHVATKSSVSDNEDSPKVTSESLIEPPSSQETRDNATEPVVDLGEEKKTEVDHVESPKATCSTDEATLFSEKDADTEADTEAGTEVTIEANFESVIEADLDVESAVEADIESNTESNTEIDTKSSLEIENSIEYSFNLDAYARVKTNTGYKTDIDAGNKAGTESNTDTDVDVKTSNESNVDIDTENDTFEDVFHKNVKRAQEFIKNLTRLNMKTRLSKVAGYTTRGGVSSPRLSVSKPSPTGPRNKSPIRAFKSTKRNKQVPAPERCRPGITFHLGGSRSIDDRGVTRSNNNNSNLECCRMFLHRSCNELLRARRCSVASRLPPVS